jgi:hypothetical protein
MQTVDLYLVNAIRKSFPEEIMFKRRPQRDGSHIQQMGGSILNRGRIHSILETK